MAKPTARQRSVRNHPLRRPHRVRKVFLVSAYGIQVSQRGNHPSVFTSVQVFVDSWNSQLSPPRVVQLKVLSAMLSFDQISILAYVECAVRAGQKALKIAM